MKAEIVKRCSVVCEQGSIVEVSESQFKALGGFAVPVKAEPEIKKTAPKGVKKKEGSHAG